MQKGMGTNMIFEVPNTKTASRRRTAVNRPNRSQKASSMSRQIEVVVPLLRHLQQLTHKNSLPKAIMPEVPARISSNPAHDPCSFSLSRCPSSLQIYTGQTTDEVCYEAARCVCYTQFKLHSHNSLITNPGLTAAMQQRRCLCVIGASKST